MSSMDNLFQQLEKRNTDRLSSQGPSELTYQEDDQSCKKSVVLNGSSNILDNFSSDKLLRTIESVGNINSYEFLSNEKTNPLNYVKDVSRNKINSSVDVMNKQAVDDTCDISNVQQTTDKSHQKIGVSKSDDNHLENTSEAAPMHHPAKLQKQNAVDIENESIDEISGHFPDISETTLRNSSDLCDEKIDNNDTSSNKENFEVISKEHQDDQKVSEVPVEGDESEVLSDNLEKEISDSDTSELLKTEDNNEDNNSSTVQDNSRKESSEKKETLQYTIPDEVPVVSGWKLDRRESGHLFWRRDSSTLNGVDPSSRVKFRYDVEVCEFESRGSETEDVLENEVEESVSEDEIRRKSCKDSCKSDLTKTSTDNSTSASMAVVFVIAVFGVMLSLMYSWVTYLFFNERIDQSQKN